MRWWTVFGIIALSVALVQFGKMSAAQKAEEGFVPLFNGKDLTGWHVMGTPAWKVEDGVLVCTGEGGGWLRSDKQYENFVLRLEFRISKGGNSGIFIRSALEGNPAFTGMEFKSWTTTGENLHHTRQAQFTMPSLPKRTCPSQRANGTSWKSYAADLGSSWR
jgi:hypothetical protein